MRNPEHLLSMSRQLARQLAPRRYGHLEPVTQFRDYGATRRMNDTTEQEEGDQVSLLAPFSQHNYYHLASHSAALFLVFHCIAQNTGTVATPVASLG